MLHAAHSSTGSSAAGANALLVAIAAIVIGGTPIHGGEGRAWGTTTGALIYTLLDNGFVLMNIASSRQLVDVGIPITLAVHVDERQRKLRLSTGGGAEPESVAPPELPVTVDAVR